MFSGKVLFLVVCAVASVMSAPKKKVPCALDDLACTSLTANTLFKTIMRGRPDNKVPSSDPLHQDMILGYVENLNYTLTDAYLYGMSNCLLKRHNINLFEFSWSFLLNCPQLILKSNYEVFGTIGGKPIYGKGQCNIVHDKYRITMRGGFEFAIDPKGRPHLRITTHDFIRLEVVGNIKSEFSNLYHGDTAQSDMMHKYINENWKTLSLLTKYPTMRAFTNKMFENINIFLHVVPSDELFFKDV